MLGISREVAAAIEISVVVLVQGFTFERYKISSHKARVLPFDSIHERLPIPRTARYGGDKQTAGMLCFDFALGVSALPPLLPLSRDATKPREVAAAA